MVLAGETRYAPDEDLIAAVQRELERVRPKRVEVAGYLAQLKAQRSDLFPAIWLGMLEQSIEYHEMLELAVSRRSVELAAWASRGLLEIRIWTRYVAASDQRRAELERNYLLDEAEILDGLSAMRSGEDSAAAGPIDEYRDEVREELAANPAARISTAAMVRELGLDREYFPLNRLLSKLVHPSAFLMVARARGGGGLAAFLSAVSWKGVESFLDIWDVLLGLIRGRLAEVKQSP